MKEIQFNNPHRQRHFDFFNNMAMPHFCITANVDITILKKWIRKNQLDFTPSMVFFIAHTANEIPEFKQRIRQNTQVVEHDLVHPSFSVYTEIADVFSFCQVKYTADFQGFTKRASLQIEKMKTQPSFEDEPGRDDFIFMSSIPWISFTGITHAMHAPVQDSVPRITWGKYFEQNEQILMPLSVQVHHALVDGKIVGKFYQNFQQIANNPDKFL